jgi:hypothetical protein
MERTEMCLRICERAKEKGYIADKMTLLMDLESADRVFNLRLEELLNADDFNFAHDIIGIMRNVDRSEYPVTNFNGFVPRFAGEK